MLTLRNLLMLCIPARFRMDDVDAQDSWRVGWQITMQRHDHD